MREGLDLLNNEIGEEISCVINREPNIKIQNFNVINKSGVCNGED